MASGILCSCSESIALGESGAGIMDGAVLEETELSGEASESLEDIV